MPMLMPMHIPNHIFTTFGFRVFVQASFFLLWMLHLSLVNILPELLHSDFDVLLGEAAFLAMVCVLRMQMQMQMEMEMQMQMQIQMQMQMQMQNAKC